MLVAGRHPLIPHMLPILLAQKSPKARLAALAETISRRTEAAGGCRAEAAAGEFGRSSLGGEERRAGAGLRERTGTGGGEGGIRSSP